MWKLSNGRPRVHEHLNSIRATGECYRVSTRIGSRHTIQEESKVHNARKAVETRSHKIYRDKLTREFACINATKKKRPFA